MDTYESCSVYGLLFYVYPNCKGFARESLRFIGDVKTAMKRYMMTYLGSKTMIGRGNWHRMVQKSSESGIEIGAVLWVDSERRYFVTKTGTTLPGHSIFSGRWRRVVNVSKKSKTETNILEVMEQYCGASSRINRCNRCHQDDLKLEKNFQVKETSLRVSSFFWDPSGFCMRLGRAPMERNDSSTNRNSIFDWRSLNLQHLLYSKPWLHCVQRHTFGLLCQCMRFGASSSHGRLLNILSW